MSIDRLGSGELIAPVENLLAQLVEKESAVAIRRRERSALLRLTLTRKKRSLLRMGGNDWIGACTDRFGPADVVPSW